MKVRQNLRLENLFSDKLELTNLNQKQCQDMSHRFFNKIWLENNKWKEFRTQFSGFIMRKGTSGKLFGLRNQNLMSLLLTK